MPNQGGFKFEIKGEVFVVQKSKAGTDVVNAYNEASAIRTKILAQLVNAPASIKISEPVAATRRVAEPAKELDLLSKAGKPK